MTEEPPDITQPILLAIRADLRAIREQQTADGRKLGTLADSLVRFTTRFDSLTSEVNGLRTDIHTVAMAIDEHGNRLAAVEERLASIESHLPTTRQ